MKEKLTFDGAYIKLVELVELIEDDEIQVDTLTEKVEHAMRLIKFCETRLREIENNINKVNK